MSPAAMSMSSMKIINKRGPSILPWGTPERTWIHSENSPFNTTLCFLSLIQLYFIVHPYPSAVHDYINILS